MCMKSQQKMHMKPIYLILNTLKLYQKQTSSSVLHADIYLKY